MTLLGVKIKSKSEVCKKRKKRGGCLPEDVRTISRNVDDFLEVERGDASFYFCCWMPHKGGKGADRASLIIERGDASIIGNITFSVSKLKLFINVGCSHSEPLIHGDMVHL